MIDQTFIGYSMIGATVVGVVIAWYLHKKNIELPFI
jgi:hypothetical protein